MEKIGKVTIAILFILIILKVSENIILSKTDKDYYFATANLNIRAGIGVDYPVLFTLKKGDKVKVLSKKGNWYKIKHFEKKGYAYSKYLKHSKPVSDIKEFSSQQTISYIILGIFISVFLFIVIIIVRKIRKKKLLKIVTEPNRGTQSERDLVLKLLKYGIMPQMIFHDLYLEKNNGEFSQIDLVVITKVGIIVFEVKDYSGWIFGSGNQSQWTQVLAYGRQKYRFYNPIKQNKKHIEELRKKIRQFAGNVPFYSVILFYGDCVLKDINFIPKGTFLVKSDRIIEVMKIIMQNNEPIQYSNKNEILRLLEEAVENGANKENQIQHIENIKDMLGKERIFD